MVPAPMSSCNCNCEQQTIPERERPNMTRILIDDPKAGLCNPCCPCAKVRAYTRLNEDSLETNDAYCSYCCCKPKDRITKKYLDQHPFIAKETLPQFVSYKEACYTCYFLNVSPVWDLCCKPLFGEIICIAPCYCKGCPRTACVRCCSCAHVSGLHDSSTFAEKLQRQVDDRRIGPNYSAPEPPPSGPSRPYKPKPIKSQKIVRAPRPEKMDVDDSIAS